VDVVLGVSMAPKTVRIVLVGREGAGGITVDEDSIDVGSASAADQVIAAILGTREGAAENGHQLQSSGVAWTDPLEADALRDALAAHKIENVMLVSAFLAAAALARAVGSATNFARTALLFVEPVTATLAVVDSADGSITHVDRQPLPEGDDAVLATLAGIVSGLESLHARPDGVVLVGSGVDIRRINSGLEAATSLSVTAPEEPETALARGAALASANAQSGAQQTVKVPHVVHDASGSGDLAYSAVDDETDFVGPEPGGRRSRTPMLAAIGALVIFVGGAVALAVALAFDIRPHVEQRPSISKNVVAHVTEAPAQLPLPAPPPPPAAPVPESVAPPAAPAPVVTAQQPVQDVPETEPPVRHWERAHGWYHRRFERVP
jgi:hypothetical protein